MEIINSQMLANWVKDERLNQGMKQNHLAEKSCLSPQAVCSLEKGRRTPTMDTFLMVVDSLGYKLVLEKKNGHS